MSRKTIQIGCIARWWTLSAIGIGIGQKRKETTKAIYILFTFSLPYQAFSLLFLLSFIFCLAENRLLSVGL